MIVSSFSPLLPACCIPAGMKWEGVGCGWVGSYRAAAALPGREEGGGRAEEGSGVGVAHLGRPEPGRVRRRGGVDGAAAQPTDESYAFSARVALLQAPAAASPIL